MSGEIVISDAIEKLKEEIRILKAKLAELLQERDDLIYHICPELRARYASEIGDYQNRANYQELIILELKRRIEIAQAALNREQQVSEEEVDKQIKREYQEFHQKVDEEYQKSQNAQKEQKEKEKKRRQNEEKWREKYRNQRESAKNTGGRDKEKNDSSSNREQECNDGMDTKAKDKPLPNAKELYRKIVKKLHPDMNPNATEHDLELFHRATKAYEEGDVVELQAIYDEVYGLDVEAETEEESADSLHSLREQLLQRISKLQEEINAIKGDFPYSEKEFLDNPQAVKAKQDAIVHLIEEYEKEITRLNEVLLEVNRKMDELKKKKRRNKHE